MTERLPANVSHFFSFPQSIFVSFLFFFVLFGLSYFSFSLHSLLTPSPDHLLSLFSLFQFSGSLSSLLLCSFQPFLVHLTSATCPTLSPFSLLVFSLLFVLFSLSPLFSSHACLIHRHKETRYICFLAILYSGNNCRVV